MVDYVDLGGSQNCVPHFTSPGYVVVIFLLIILFHLLNTEAPDQAPVQASVSNKAHVQASVSNKASTAECTPEEFQVIIISITRFK